MTAEQQSTKLQRYSDLIYTSYLDFNVDRLLPKFKLMIYKHFKKSNYIFSNKQIFNNNFMTVFN